jgi:glycosyltransferase involved in cell wall biosynthesis
MEEKLMKKPGLLFVVNCFSPGGAEVFIMRLAEFLKADFRIFILTVFENENDEKFLDEFLRKADAKLLRRYQGLQPKQDKLFWKLNAFGALFGFNGLHGRIAKRDETLYYKSLIKKYDIRVVNSHLFSADAFVKAKIRAGSFPAWVVTMHSSYNPSNFEHLAQDQKARFLAQSRENLLGADKVFCVAEFNKQIFLDQGWSPLPEKVYIGIASRKDLPTHKAPRPFVFCMVGRAIKEKGWEIALEAFSMLNARYPDTELLVIAPENEYMSGLKDKYSANPGIRFTGYLSDPIPVMATAHCGLLPSWGESLPYSVIEFLSLGIPVIVSERGEMPLMIDSPQGMAGCVLSDDENGMPSRYDLAEKMEKHLINANKLYVAHKSNAPHAFSKFSMDHCGGRYREVFLNLIHENA